MNATRIRVDAKLLAGKVFDVESKPLAAADCKVLPIVFLDDEGKFDLIDGYHRVAGMIAAGETSIPCVLCDDAKLCGIAADAEDLEAQEEALATIYAALV